MANLGIPTNTLKVLEKYNFSFQKKFGQNFLIDTHILEGIISGAGITKDDCVLEIGPGIGALSSEFCNYYDEVVSVEIDKSLIPILDETMSQKTNFKVINQGKLEHFVEQGLSRLAWNKSDGSFRNVVTLQCDSAGCHP